MKVIFESLMKFKIATTNFVEIQTLVCDSFPSRSCIVTFRTNTWCHLIRDKPKSSQANVKSAVWKSQPKYTEYLKTRRCHCVLTVVDLMSLPKFKDLLYFSSASFVYASGASGAMRIGWQGSGWWGGVGGEGVSPQDPLNF